MENTTMNEPTPTKSKLDGSWMDESCACRVCGGEIPSGHLEHCDVYKQEMRIHTLENALSAATTALRESQARERVLRDALFSTSAGIQEWCDAVDNDASWDGWDCHFKHWKWEGLPKLDALLSYTPPPDDKWKAVAEKLADDTGVSQIFAMTLAHQIRAGRKLNIQAWLKDAEVRAHNAKEALTAYQKAITDTTL